MKSIKEWYEFEFKGIWRDEMVRDTNLILRYAAYAEEQKKKEEWDRAVYAREAYNNMYPMTAVSGNELRFAAIPKFRDWFESKYGPYPGKSGELIHESMGRVVDAVAEYVDFLVRRM